MKKQICFLTMAVLFAMSFYSCKKSDSEPEPVPVTVSPNKSMGVVYGTDVERYDITYDANKRITQILDYWNNALDKTITYDWSVAGKLTITSGTTVTVYDINSNSFIETQYYSGAKLSTVNTDFFCCLITNTHIIKIGNEIFWDWEDHFIK